MLTRKESNLRSVYTRKGVCICRIFGNDFRMLLVTALQLKCDPVSLTSRIQTDPFRTKTLSVLSCEREL